MFFGNGAWCSACHNGVNFTDEQFHNIGIGLDAEQANRNLDYRYTWVGNVTLSDQDKRDLIAFIRACSGPLPQVEIGRLPE